MTLTHSRADFPEDFLFGVSTLDPLTFAAVALLVAAIAGVAILLPAARAARTDPSDALRAE